MNVEKIGSFITECRNCKGITQQQLADQLGITNKAVSKWETGQGMPDISIIPALAEILGVTADELLSGEKRIGNNPDKKEFHTGLLFGIWFEICSISVFFAFYIILKNEIKSYNRHAIDKISCTQLGNKYLKIFILAWIILPVIFCISLICDIFTMNINVKTIGTVIVYVPLCLVMNIKILGKKAE